VAACVAALLGLSAVGVVAAERVAPESGAPKSREFFFTYKATVTGLEPGKTARIWLPVPSNNEDQQVRIIRQVAPAEGRLGKESKYGNQIYYLEAKGEADGTVEVALTFRVKRLEVKGDAMSRVEQGEIEKFLKPDARVPIGGKPLALIEGRQMPSDQLELGKFLYDVVNDHMAYSKDKPGWGFGDAEWACDSRFGNCTDFHSLFISLARTKKMPAKFEMGFSVPEKRGGGDIAGYHCWAKFKPEGCGWIPVDISEANKVKTTKPEMVQYYFGNLTEDRVTFTVGRDLTLVPPQDGPPLNFLIYPYVEVDGKPYDSAKVMRAFSYEDIAAK
jgi:transglutaminase-like putative cysteine protease